jgi:uncharacterized membrane protein SpoIIM required for sporulation
VDIDVFTATHASRWERLRELSAKRQLTGAEADELVLRYRQGATDLSQLRSSAPDPTLVSQLSIILVKARGRIGNPHDISGLDVLRFFTRTIPAALYRMRWWTLGSTLLCLLVFTATAVYCTLRPDALEAIMTPAQQQWYVDEAFAQYYSTYPNASFTAEVWTNNAFIAALCVATGITGVFPAQILFENSVVFGATAAVMANHGAAWVFWSLVLPHGLLELSCVFLAGAAGVRLLWALLVPGTRTRAQSLAHEGRSTIVVVVALTLFLLLSGLIEGFITPWNINPFVKIGIGAAACALLWVCSFYVGKLAVQAGETPTGSREELAAEVPTA